jgi:hypothetical protein
MNIKSALSAWCALAIFAMPALNATSYRDTLLLVDSAVDTRPTKHFYFIPLEDLQVANDEVIAQVTQEISKDLLGALNVKVKLFAKADQQAIIIDGQSSLLAAFKKQGLDDAKIASSLNVQEVASPYISIVITSVPNS